MYILITPAKNEGINLRAVAPSVINQSLRPSLWIIIDDGSNDDTAVVLEELTLENSWIKPISMPPSKRDIMAKYAYICRVGFDHAIAYCKENNIDYDFLGILDADTQVEIDFFEKLIYELRKDDKLGIISGGIYNNIDGSVKLESKGSLPAGTGRLWKRECFEQTGFYVEPCPDSISNVKAILRGWHIRRFNPAIAIHRRRASSVEGLWKGYNRNGWAAYYLNKHPLLVIGIFLYLIVKPPYYIGFSFLAGYITALVRKEPKIKDSEIKDYYYNKRLAMIIKSIVSRYYD